MQTRQGGIGVFLILIHMATLGNRIPPVTLVAIAAQIIIYTNFFQFELPSLNKVCVSNVDVWYRQDWRRLFLAPLFHASDMHLYYNMASFLWKGRLLEGHLGSGHFALLLAAFAGLTSAATLPLNWAAEQVMQRSHYLTDCAVGFSGVIFGLKVLTCHFLPATTTHLLGFIPIPIQYAVWAELVLIQVLVPNVSFTGHLAGILVGLVYIYGPLAAMLDVLLPAENRRLHNVSTSRGGSRWWTGQPSYTYASGRPGYREEGGSGGVVRRGGPAGLGEYTGGATEEEQVRWAQQGHQQTTGNSAPTPPGQDRRRKNANEIRQLRLARFGSAGQSSQGSQNFS